MAGLPQTLILLCVAAAPLSSASSVRRSAVVVQSGQNVSLTCNLTSTDITWYLLRSDQLLRLLTVTLNNVGDEMVDFHISDSRRIHSPGALGKGPVSLAIRQVEEKDAGLYLCSVRCAGSVCFDRGIRLIVNGESTKQPWWTLMIYVAPAILVPFVVIVIIAGFYLCSGKSAVCCCYSVRSNTSVKVTEEEPLNYSGLIFADRPRPPCRGGTGLAHREVTYSSVMQ